MTSSDEYSNGFVSDIPFLYYLNRPQEDYGSVVTMYFKRSPRCSVRGPGTS